MRAVCLAFSVCSAFLAGSLAAASESSDWAESYREQLRREIAERARALREAKRDGFDETRVRVTPTVRDTSARTRTGSSNTSSVSVANPFGPAFDFNAPARDARLGQESLPLDLNGRPLQPIRIPTRTTVVAPTTTTPTTAAADDKKAKESESEATARIMEAARLLYDNGEFGAARQMVLPLTVSRRLSQQEVDSARALVERVDAEGMKRLVEADEAAARGDLDKAASAYAAISQKFGSAPAARLAQGKLVVLRENPDIASRFLLERARGYVDKKRLDIAMPMLRDIVRRFGDTTAAAKEAAALLAELERTAAAGGGLSPEQELAARKWLIIGDIHALNARNAEAIRSYERVIQDFEDSKYAESARNKIAALRESE